MSIKLNGATNGSVEIDVPAAVGSDLSVTIPATAGDIVVKGTDGSVDLGDVNIDSSGRLLVGTSTTDSFRISSINYTPGAQVKGTFPFGSMSLTSPDDGGVLWLAKSNTLTAADNNLGIISFNGSDGTNILAGARIQALTDGACGTDDLPTRLVFSTTADGASSPTERIRIGNSGNVTFFNMNYVYAQTDNAVGLGFSGNRYTSVWAANGTIQTSDERAKTEINNSLLGSDFVKALRPVSYKWIEGGNRSTGEMDENNNLIYESVPGERTHWGFIAQEVKQAVDAAGVDFGGWVLTDKDDPDSQQALRYDQFIAPLTKALQEAIAKIETLETRLTALGGGAS